MAQTFHLMEQAERSRRLARDSTDREMSERLPGLADEYAARAKAEQEAETDGHPAAPLGGVDGQRPA